MVNYVLSEDPSYRRNDPMSPSLKLPSLFSHYFNVFPSFYYVLMTTYPYLTNGFTNRQNKTERFDNTYIAVTEPD